MNTEQTERVDIYTEITNAVIHAIEAGAGTYEMPWSRKLANELKPLAAIPVNAASGQSYRGANVLALWMRAQARGYGTNFWATYRQWAELGAHVRKGEKGTHVAFWKFFESSNESQDEDATDTPRSSRRPPLVRFYSVFNASQVEGWTIPESAPVTEPNENRDAKLEGFFAATGADIREGGDQAYYQPTSDHIQMPTFGAFASETSYYSVLAHELTHWTGHITRCARDLATRFGTQAYAMEELVAELGSAFIGAELGLQLDPRKDHAPYVQNWISVLKDDKRAIFTAASKAQYAVDWILKRQPQAAAA